MPLDYSPRFRFQYARLPLSTRLKVQKALRLLNADFRHPGLKSHTVQGHEGIYEAYVDQKYRMTYERRGDLIAMRNVDNHDECLKNP
jgi:hypothetical protein